MSAKYTCRYCQCEASPRNLLQILTLPGIDTVIHVCALCVLTEYEVDRAAHQMVLTAEVILANAAGDEAAVVARLSPVASTAALFLL